LAEESDDFIKNVSNRDSRHGIELPKGMMDVVSDEPEE